MSTLNDTLVGADGTLLTSRSGWAASIGFYGVFRLDGSQRIKMDAYSEDPQSAFATIAEVNHYVEAIVGAGFLTGGVHLAVAVTSRSEWVGVTYDAAGSALRVLGNNGASVQLLTGVGASAGDTLRLEWTQATQTLVVKKNGVTVFNGTTNGALGTRNGTSTGLIVFYGGQAAKSDVIRQPYISGPLGGGDTTPPVLTGVISVTNLTSTSYDLSWPAATDNVAVAGYEVSLNGGASWDDVGNVTSLSVSGRTPSSTDSVRVRAKDTATPPNYSTPPLAEEVTLLDPASPPVATVVSTVVSGQSVTVEGTYTGDVDTATIFIPAAAVPNGAIDVGPLPVTFAGGAFDVTIDDLPPGSYDPPEVTMTNSGGSDTDFGTAFEILGIDGDPTPEPPTPRRRMVVFG